MPAKTLLSQRLRAARQAIHPPVTQCQVAARLKLSPSAVNLWEAGKTQPAAEDLAELARWYGVSTDWLLGVEAIKVAQQRGRPPAALCARRPPSELVKWHWDAVSEPVLRRYIREAADEYLIADDTRYPTFNLESGARILGRVVEVTLRKIL